MKKLTNLGKNQLTTSSTNNKNSNVFHPSNTNTNNQIYPLHHKRVKSYFTLKNIQQNKQPTMNITNIITQITKSSTSYNTTNNINHTMSLLKNHRSLSPQYKKKFLLPEKISHKKTLVLDLDETLVHSGFFPFDSPSDVIIQIELENETHDIHVLVRPFVKEFLERMSKKYELVIFTASLSKYANPLLNIIDKNSHCLFRLFREHCTLINTAFVKDLTRLGRDLKDVIILDNSPIAYALNPDNGFPIKSWFDDRNDCELLKIIPILEFLSYVPDVRDYIKKIVKNNQIQFDIVPNIIQQYNRMLKKTQLPISLRYKGTPLFSALVSPKMKKSSSGKEGNIKKVYIENTKLKGIKKIKKELNITDDVNSNKNINTNPLEIKKYHEDLKKNTKMNSFPNNINLINHTQKIKRNISNKKVISNPNQKSNEKIFDNLLTQLKHFLYETNRKVKPSKNVVHKKNTLSMSQRVTKNILEI